MRVGLTNHNYNQRIQILDPKLSYQMAVDEVHVWCTSLIVPQQDLERYGSILSPDEVARAERYYFERDRIHFIAGRGLLRTLLGGYLELEPSQLQFSYQDYGKPFLETTCQNRALQFNISHSNGLVVFAFSWNRRVGIDVEHIHPMDNEEQFAEQLFSTQESHYLKSLPIDQKSQAFFSIWTCKEAFLKACGAGLTVPINQVEVLLIDEDLARLTALDGNQEQTAGWHLELFKPAAGYQASLAVEGHDWRLVFTKREFNI